MNGQSMYKTQRVGAGSLGPNFAIRGKLFLPALQEAKKNIHLKDTLRTKLQSPSTLSREEWEQVGKSRLLSTVVLDDIFQKYRDYKSIDK